MRHFLVSLLVVAVALSGMLGNGASDREDDVTSLCTINVAPPLPFEPGDGTRVRASTIVSVFVGLKSSLCANYPEEMPLPFDEFNVEHPSGSVGLAFGRTLQAQHVRWQI